MSTDKREFEGNDSTGALKKRKVLDELSEEGPLTQEDVVYFQKEAIFRQMQKYKSQVTLLNRKYNNLNEEFSVNSSKLVLLKSWIEEFIQYIITISPASTSGGDISEFADLFAETPSNIKDEEFVKFSEEQRQKLSSVIAGITPDSVSTADIKEKISEVEKKYHAALRKNEDLTNKLSQLSKNYDDLNISYSELLNQTERLQSKTIKRVNQVKKEEGEEEAKKEKGEAQDSNQQTNGGDSKTVKEETANGNGNTGFNDEEYLNLKHRVEELNTTVGAQKKEIDEVLELNKRLNSQLIETAQNGLGAENPVSKSPNPTHETDELHIKYKESLTKYDALFERFNSLESESSSFSELFNKNFEEDKAKIASTFERLESDLVRIRTNRDELLSKISILESEKTSLEVTEELKKLVEVQRQQIENMNFDKKLNEISEFTLDVADLETLKKHNVVLTNELQELEKAFKHVQNVSIKKLESVSESQSIVHKLKVEKTKADQKYFAAMRSQDSIIQENKTLKVQVAKLTEMISSLKETETLMNTKVENLTNQIKNFKKIEFFKKNEIDQYVIKINEVEHTSKNQSAKLEEYKKLVQSFHTSNDDLLKLKTEQSVKISKLEFSLKSKDKLINRFKSSGLHSDLTDSSELESFRSLVYCSLCSKNWKNTALKVCGHVFCEECARERLAARMRKCPTCNKQFSSNDLLTIHL